jgi:hypothetical protein
MASVKQEELDLGWTESKLDKRFREFDERHPEIYHLFCRFTREAARAGFKHYSARAVAHRIRWHTQVEVGVEEPFKLNNNHVRRYALKFMREHPEFDGFFRTRRSREGGQGR